MRSKQLLVATMLAFLTLFLPYAQAKTEVSVDSNEILPGESFSFTLRSDQNKSADFRQLEANFNIHSRMQQSSIRVINGQYKSVTTWQFVVSPKVAGDKESVTLPSFKVGSDTTKPVKIKYVAPPPISTQYQDEELVQVTQKLIKKEIFIQESNVIEVSVKMLSELRPRINQAELKWDKNKDVEYQQLDSINKEVTENGKRYFVTTYIASVTPKKSGIVELPPIALEMNITNKNRRVNYSFSSNPETLNVKPIPSNYPTNVSWQPATDVSINEYWDRDINNLKVGEPVNRTLFFSVSGLHANQITPPTLNDSNGVKVYAGGTDLKTSFNKNLPFGTFSIEYSYIPTESGTIRLPEVPYIWFNTNTNQIEQTMIPSATLTVGGAAALSHTQSPTQNAAATNSNTQNGANPITPPTQSESNQAAAPQNDYWQWIAIIFMITSLILFIGCWYLIARNKRASSAQSKEPTLATVDKSAHYNQLKQACAKNDLHSIKQHLDGYLQASNWSLGELMSKYPKFKEAVNQINQSLYGDSPTDTNQQLGKNLMIAVDEIHQDKQRVGTKSNLPPLYPK